MITLSEPFFDHCEIEAVKRVVESKWLTMGDLVAKWERMFAEKLNARHAIAVGNCTQALHLANIVLGVGPGDEVIVPSMTFVATANSIRYAGGVPVFADINSLEDPTVSPASIKRLINKKTKGICVVHYAGYACDMEEIIKIARENGLFIIEDAAHCPGAILDGKYLGTIGDIGCFSFFSNKNITTGEGGMIVTNDDKLAERTRLLRSHGMTSMTFDRHKGHSFSYDVIDLGYNYRPTEITAALGICQLEKLDHIISLRKYLSEEYISRLEKIEGLKIPFKKYRGNPSIHIMPVVLPKNLDRNQLMNNLRKKEIQTSIHYRPIHTFSYYKKTVLHKDNLRVTEEYGERVLTLPFYTSMSEEIIAKVTKILAEEIDNGRKYQKK